MKNKKRILAWAILIFTFISFLSFIFITSGADFLATISIIGTMAAIIIFGYIIFWAIEVLFL